MAQYLAIMLSQIKTVTMHSLEDNLVPVHNAIPN